MLFHPQPCPVFLYGTAKESVIFDILGKSDSRFKLIMIQIVVYLQISLTCSAITIAVMRKFPEPAKSFLPPGISHAVIKRVHIFIIRPQIIPCCNTALFIILKKLQTIFHGNLIKSLAVFQQPLIYPKNIGIAVLVTAVMPSGWRVRIPVHQGKHFRKHHYHIQVIPVKHRLLTKLRAKVNLIRNVLMLIRFFYGGANSRHPGPAMFQLSIPLP